MTDRPPPGVPAPLSPDAVYALAKAAIAKLLVEPADIAGASLGQGLDRPLSSAETRAIALEVERLRQDALAALALTLGEQKAIRDANRRH